MAKSEEMVMIPKRKLERIAREARETSERFGRRIEELRRERREVQERHRQARRRSY